MSLLRGLVAFTAALYLSSCNFVERVTATQGAQSVRSEVRKVADYSVVPPKIRTSGSGADFEEDLRLIYAYGALPRAEIQKIKSLGFNAIMYYPGFEEVQVSREFLEDCWREQVFAVFPPDEKFNGLESHPGILGFYSFDEPEGHLTNEALRLNYCNALQVPLESCSPITIQNAQYQKLKRRSEKPVFITRADFSDIAFRSIFSNESQDVVLIDSYPYRADMNPSSSSQWALESVFKLRSLIELNRVGIDKSKLRKAIPVLQGFADEREKFGLSALWTFGEMSLYGRGFMGLFDTRAYGVFIWSYPISSDLNQAGSEHLIGLGQTAERTIARQYLESYKRFKSDLDVQASIPLEFLSLTGRQLVAAGREGNLLIPSSSSVMTDGHGERIQLNGAVNKGNLSTVVIPLARKDGAKFQRVHVGVGSLNQYDLSKTGRVTLRISLSTDGVNYLTYYGPTVKAGEGRFEAGFKLHQVVISTGAQSNASLKIEVDWDGISSEYLALTGISVGLQ